MSLSCKGAQTREQRKTVCYPGPGVAPRVPQKGRFYRFLAWFFAPATQRYQSLPTPFERVNAGMSYPGDRIEFTRYGFSQRFNFCIECEGEVSLPPDTHRVWRNGVLVVHL